MADRRRRNIYDSVAGRPTTLVWDESSFNKKLFFLKYFSIIENQKNA